VWECKRVCELWGVEAYKPRPLDSNHPRQPGHGELGWLGHWTAEQQACRRPMSLWVTMSGECYKFYHCFCHCYMVQKVPQHQDINQ
jgi:hypothetical protein